MTDNTQDPGVNPERVTPERPSGAAPFEVNAAGEAGPAAPAAPADKGESVAMAASSHSPADSQHSDAESSDAESSYARPSDAQPSDERPTASPAPQSQQPTLAYPADAFGRPAAGTTAPNPYAPQIAPPTYAGVAGQPPYGGPTPNFGTDAARDPKRRTSIALIAALAVGALVGGASGAGVTAFVLTNQNDSERVSQAQGPSSVVVNNTESVNQITAVAAKATPSVVTIEASSGNSGGTGSGVVLTDDGYVLTNTHVVTLDGASADSTIQVKSSDGRLYAATIVGTDPISDLAVIKLTDASGMTPIAFADSAKLNVGDTAIAIGAPLGLAGTVTDGIVSALNRSISIASSAAPSTPDGTPPDDQRPFFFDLPDQDGNQPRRSAPTGGSISLSVIQTDAAINPGNSGGALLNAKGELIGINVAIANAGGASASAAGNIGVGFSIPSNLAKRISDELIADGTATHGLLGASVTSAASDAESTTVGALISEVSSGGAAEKAGLRKGDVITTFNGVPITDANDLTAQVRALAAGADADLTYLRGGKSVTVSVTVGELAG